MKKVLPLAVGATAGLYVGPMILNALNIPQSPGFGVDDLVVIASIVAGVYAADMLIG